MIKQVYPLDDMELNGTVRADMTMAGHLSYIEKEQYDRFSASGTIALSDMNLKMKEMPDIEIKNPCSHSLRNICNSVKRQ